jgi:hypothetical protein
MATIISVNTHKVIERVEKYSCRKDTARAGLVGTGGFEPPTCRLGGGRSIQLSYVPANHTSSLDQFGQRLRPFCPISRR